MEDRAGLRQRKEAQATDLPSQADSQAIAVGC
jgi:hypothetical protein